MSPNDAFGDFPSTSGAAGHGTFGHGTRVVSCGAGHVKDSILTYQVTTARLTPRQNKKIWVRDWKALPQKKLLQDSERPRSSTVCCNPHGTMADEDLSEEQLKQLLVEAEQRMKGAKSQKLLQTQNPSSQRRYVQCPASSSTYPTGAF
jgi:hypothetical protein